MGSNGGPAPVELRAALPRSHLPGQEPELMLANQALSFPCAIVDCKKFYQDTLPPSHPGHHGSENGTPLIPSETWAPQGAGGCSHYLLSYLKQNSTCFSGLQDWAQIGGIYLAGTEENSRNIRRLDGKTMSFQRDGTLKIDLFNKDSQNLGVDLNQPIWSLTAELQPWIGTERLDNYGGVTGVK